MISVMEIAPIGQKAKAIKNTQSGGNPKRKYAASRIQAGIDQRKFSSILIKHITIKLPVLLVCLKVFTPPLTLICFQIDYITDHRVVQAVFNESCINILYQ